MNGDSCSLVSKDARLTLSDMTNLPMKRGISSILGDLLLKSGDESANIVAREGSGVKFSKRLCLVVDDLVKESTKTSGTNEGFSSDDKNSFFDGDSENVYTDVKESQGETDALDMRVEPYKGGDSSDAGKETCKKESDVTVCGSQTDAITGEDLGLTVFSRSSSETDDKLAVVDNKDTKGVGLLFPDSQAIKSFNMSRCSAVEGMGIVNHNMGADDDLKSCTCSFCLKAAYIWSDLHYQDIKGRISVLKKSQKEANRLIQRNAKGKPTDIYASDNSNNSSNTENLIDQWTSLFLNMEGILARESNHLQNCFVAMKELREDCKIDLERATKTPQQKNT